MNCKNCNGLGRVLYGEPCSYCEGSGEHRPNYTVTLLEVIFGSGAMIWLVWSAYKVFVCR